MHHELAARRPAGKSKRPYEAPRVTRRGDLKEITGSRRIQSDADIEEILLQYRNEGLRK